MARSHPPAASFVMGEMPAWSEFQTQLRRFIGARVSNQADVEDLLQLILERAISKAGQVKDVENAVGWLFTIARNAIHDHHRLQRRSPLVATPEPPEQSADSDDAAPEAAGRASVLSCLEPFLVQLAPDARQALLWADVDERSMQEIAAALQLSVSGAKSRVQRARKELLQGLLRCCAVTLDARGRATDLEPKASGCGGCGSDGCPKPGGAS
jgi:RNA polymerase sigma-70 factor, ECF subfamily